MLTSYFVIYVLNTTDQPCHLSTVIYSPNMSKLRQFLLRQVEFSGYTLALHFSFSACSSSCHVVRDNGGDHASREPLVFGRTDQLSEVIFFDQRVPILKSSTFSNEDDLVQSSPVPRLSMHFLICRPSSCR